MPKKQNGFIRNRKLIFLLPILLFATVGSYFIYTSEAKLSRYIVMYWGATIGESNFVTPKAGDPARVQILLSVSDDGRPPTAPTNQAISVFSYDTRYYKYVNGKCEWRYGCRISSMDTANLRPHDPVVTDLHKTRVAICFNVPANVKVEPAERVFMHNLQRTPYMTGPGSKNTLFIFRSYTTEGSCESNPTALGYEEGSGSNRCGEQWGYACDENTDPGVNCTNFIGVSNCIGSGPGNGNGSGGTGTGINGQGSGIGPGVGSGGGGSSAKKIADQPNNIPDSSSQGENKQTELEPSPFFDGKEFERGSDSDTLASTVRSTSKKIANTWPLVLGVIVLGGAAGFGIWRWNNGRNGYS